MKRENFTWQAILLAVLTLFFSTTTFAWYDLYCGEHPAAKNYECFPATVGDWVYHGGSYPYQLQYHHFSSIDAMLSLFESEVKAKYSVCSIDASVDSIREDRFDFHTIFVRTNIILTAPTCRDSVSSLNTFSAWRHRQSTCEAPGLGPYSKSLDDIPYCAYPLLPEETSCPTDTPTLPGTGVKLLREADVNGAGTEPLHFTRHYRSRWPNGVPSASMPMGAGWTHTYDRSIHFIAGAPNPLLRALRGDGAWRSLVRDDSQSSATNIIWRDISPGNTQDRLTQHLDAQGQTLRWLYRPHHDDSLETYDADGQLKTIKARNGNVTTLVYSSASTPLNRAPYAGLLLAVRNAFGRELRLSYDSAGHLNTLTLPSGEILRYEHDALGNLSAFSRPGADPGDASRITKRYHYEDTRNPNTHALTGLTDEQGVRITTYTYDAQGQVASTEKAQGLEKLSFQYSNPVGASSASSTIYYTPTPGAASIATQYSFSSLAGVLRPTSVTTPCPLCGVSAATTDYDANQRKSRVIGHDGRVTFYSYNATGRITREATYPASLQSATTAPPLNQAERVTSTQWHGTWNLPLKTAEAYLITSYSYDGKGNLLEMIETPTTDATGAKGFNAVPSGDAQTTQWTYDTRNLPSTIVEQSAGVETGRWNISYDTKGDMVGITHVTSGTVATLVPLGDGTSQVTAITQQASPAVSPAMATVRALGFARASAAAGEMEFLRGGRIATSDIVKAGSGIRSTPWGFLLCGILMSNDLGDACDDKPQADECKTPSPPKDTPKVDWSDPTKPPIGVDGKEWVWERESPQGGKEGGYKNPSKPWQSAHPDLDHGPPYGSHWDFTDRYRRPKEWRLFPDGTIKPK